MSDLAKKNAAEQALALVPDNAIVGVGTGSTVKYFIEGLAAIKTRIQTTVSSSQASTDQLKSLGIPVDELNNIGSIDIYVDGADEVTPHKAMIKGAGGALLREKILAAASQQFVCIVDPSKCVDRLGKVPLPIEVLPMARSFVARQLVALGGQPVYRTGYVTDNGHIILDCSHLDCTDPSALETQLNNIPGIIECGLFAHRLADQVIVGQA